MAENAAPLRRFRFFLPFLRTRVIMNPAGNRLDRVPEIRFERGYVIMMDLVERADQNVTEGTGR